MMKNGIALIITLGIIAIITALVLSNVTLVDSSFRQNTKMQTMIQNQLILTNMDKALGSLTSKVTNAESLEALFQEVQGLSDDDGKFILGFALRPLQGKVNLNAIFKEDNKTLDPAYQELLFNILTQNEVQSPNFMIALIADTIDLDSFDRLPESERINKEVDFSNGAIKSFDLLRRLSEIYSREMKDANILKVKWEDYFFLGPLFTRAPLDCNHLNWELTRALSLKVKGSEGVDDISCDMMGRDQNETIARYNIAPYQKETPYLIEVETEFEIEGKKGRFKAHYDLKDKRISDINIFNAL